MCQPGRPRPHGDGQLRLGRLVGLGALPQREVARVALGPVRSILGAAASLRLLPGELPVLRERADVEVDVAGSVGRRVGVPVLDQLRDQLVHLRDVPGRARLVGRRQHAEPRVVLGQDPLVGVRDDQNGTPCLGRLDEDLVVDVGDVADERDLVAGVQQPAAQHVIVDAGTKVADVRRRLHGEPTQVDPDLTGTRGTKSRTERVAVS